MMHCNNSVKAMNYNLSFVNNNSLSEVSHYTSESYRISKILETLVLNKAIIIPSKQEKSGFKEGGIYTSDGKFVKSATLNGVVPPSKVEFSTKNINQSDDTIIFIGTFYSLWGHAITDSIKKLWFLFTEEGKQLLDNGAKVGYIFRDKGDSYTLSVIEKTGVNPNDLIEIKEPTQFKNVYIPDSSIIYNPKDETRYYTKEYTEIINRIIDCYNKTYNSDFREKYDKVYFSRRRIFQNGRDWGEDKIEKVFRKLGYKVMYPEKLSFFEQIHILRNCSHFATTEGSISHTIIFCKPQTKIELVRKCNRLNFHQLMINEAAQLDVTYIDANKSVVIDERMPLHGPFYLCITKELRHFYKKPLLYTPYWLCFSYWWHLLNKNDYIRKNIKQRHIIHKIEFFFWKLKNNHE